MSLSRAGPVERGTRDAPGRSDSTEKFARDDHHAGFDGHGF